MQVPNTQTPIDDSHQITTDTIEIPRTKKDRAYLFGSLIKRKLEKVFSHHTTQGITTLEDITKFYEQTFNHDLKKDQRDLYDQLLKTCIGNNKISIENLLRVLNIQIGVPNGILN